MLSGLTKRIWVAVIARAIPLLVAVGTTADLTAGSLNCSVSFPEAIMVDQNTIFIPFRMVGRLIAVEARVDTVQGTFLVDTGASDLLLNENYFDGEYLLRGQIAAGVTGVAGEVQARVVDTMFWDNLEIKNLIGHVVSLAHIEDQKKTRITGILGYNALKDFEVLIDYSIRQMVVTRLDSKGNRLDQRAIYQTAVDSVKFALVGHTIVIKGEVNGVKLRMGLDTGAELNLLDVSVRKRALDKFEILRRVKMIGSTRQPIEVLAGVLYEFDCGIEQEPGMRTLLTRMEELNTALDTSLDGVLGYEFLFDKRTLINYKKRMLYFFESAKS